MEKRFDLYELPAGHAQRFLGKLEARARRRRILWGSLAAAAVVVLGIFVSRSPEKDYFRSADASPEAVYLSYLEQVGASYAAIAALPDSEGTDWEGAMRSVTEETIPLFEQLPEELSDREKTALLKAYYGDLLAGVEKIRKSVTNP